MMQNAAPSTQAVTWPMTDAQLRASGVPVTEPAIGSRLGLWLLLVVAACGPSASVRSARCRAQSDQIVRSSGSCYETMGGLRQLVRCSPECGSVIGFDGGSGPRCGLTP